MGIAKNVSRQKATLVVKKYKRHLVFAVGDVCVNALRPGLFSGYKPLERVPLTVAVVRDGKIYDRGRIEEVGTHGACDRFLGFERFVPNDKDKPFVLAYGLDHLLASWFKVGDELYLSCTNAVFLKTLREEWGKQLTVRKPFANAYTLADQKHLADIQKLHARYEKETGLSIQEITTKKGMEEKAKSLYRAARRINRRHFGPIELRIEAVPFPDILVVGPYHKPKK